MLRGQTGNKVYPQGCALLMVINMCAGFGSIITAKKHSWGYIKVYNLACICIKLSSKPLHIDQLTNVYTLVNAVFLNQIIYLHHVARECYLHF